MSDDRFRGEETQLVTTTLQGYRTWRFRGRALSSVSMTHTWSESQQKAHCHANTPAAHVHLPNGQLDPVFLDEKRNNWRNYADTHSYGSDRVCVLRCWLQHPVPMGQCHCGIYGWYAPDTSDLFSFSGEVVGVTKNSGRILLGTKGFRAERSEIVAVAPFTYSVAEEAYLLHHLKRARSTFYPSVTVFSTPAAMFRAYPPDVALLSSLGIDTYVAARYA